MRFFTFIAFCLLVIACKSDKGLDNIELKKFFWDIDAYETPKVMVYNIDNLGKKSKCYFLFEKQNDSVLRITRYDNTFTPVQQLTDKYTGTGVVLLESVFSESSSALLKTSLNIKSSLIFSFENPDTTLFINSTYQSKTDKNTEIIDNITWRLNEISVKKFNNQDLVTIIANGSIKSSIRDISTKQTNYFTMIYNIWYSEGIGITNIIQKFDDGTINETYSKTIAYEEFLNLQNRNKKMN